MEPSSSVSDAKRQAAAQEILATERTYVKGLSILCDVFFNPLRLTPKFLLLKKPKIKDELENSAKRLLSADQLAQIFGNVDTILGLHKDLLKELEERFKHWSDDQKLGDIFVARAPFLKMYTVYLNNFENAMDCLAACKKQNPEFATYLEMEHRNPELEGLNIVAYLLLPVQRIPRYRMLLETVIRHTSPEHRDYEDLKKALESINTIAESVNESLREAEAGQKVLEIQNMMTGIEESIVEPARKYIFDGELTKISRRAVQRRWFFLFNDLLVYAKKLSATSFQYKGRITLASSWIRDIPDSKKTKVHNLFQVVDVEKTYTMFADNKEQKKLWMKYLQDAIDELIESRPGLLELRSEAKTTRSSLFFQPFTINVDALLEGGQRSSEDQGMFSDEDSEDPREKVRTGWLRRKQSSSTLLARKKSIDIVLEGASKQPSLGSPLSSANSATSPSASSDSVAKEAARSGATVTTTTTATPTAADVPELDNSWLDENERWKRSTTILDPTAPDDEATATGGSASSSVAAIAVEATSGKEGRMSSASTQESGFAESELFHASEQFSEGDITSTLEDAAPGQENVDASERVAEVDVGVEEEEEGGVVVDEKQASEETTAEKDAAVVQETAAVEVQQEQKQDEVAEQDAVVVDAQATVETAAVETAPPEPSVMASSVKVAALASVQYERSVVEVDDSKEEREKDGTTITQTVIAGTAENVQALMEKQQFADGQEEERLRALLAEKKELLVVQTTITTEKTLDQVMAENMHASMEKMTERVEATMEHVEAMEEKMEASVESTAKKMQHNAESFLEKLEEKTEAAVASVASIAGLGSKEEADSEASNDNASKSPVTAKKVKPAVPKKPTVIPPPKSSRFSSADAHRASGEAGGAMAGGFVGKTSYDLPFIGNHVLLSQMEALFVGPHEKLSRPDRLLLLDAKMIQITPERPNYHWRRVLLLDDALVLIKELPNKKWQFKGEFSLLPSWISDSHLQMDDKSFQLSSLEETVTLRAQNLEVKAKWTTTLRGVLDYLAKQNPSMFELPTRVEAPNEDFEDESRLRIDTVRESIIEHQRLNPFYNTNEGLISRLCARDTAVSVAQSSVTSSLSSSSSSSLSVAVNYYSNISVVLQQPLSAILTGKESDAVDIFAISESDPQLSPTTSLQQQQQQPSTTAAATAAAAESDHKTDTLEIW